MDKDKATLTLQCWFHFVRVDVRVFVGPGIIDRDLQETPSIINKKT